MKKIKLLIVIAFFSIRGYAQYPEPPLMTSNDYVNDYDYRTCEQVRTIPLHFYAGYNYTLESESGIYHWTLLRNNEEISYFDQLIVCDLNCYPQCDLPHVQFENVSPAAGTYQIKLVIHKYRFYGAACVGIWAEDVASHSDFEIFSNRIKIHRLDETTICKCETPYDLIVSCAELSDAPNTNMYKTKHDITINCEVTNAKILTLKGTNAVYLKTGFQADAGSSFIAMIERCDFVGNRMAGTTETGNNSTNIYAKNENKTRMFSNAFEAYPNPFTNNIQFNYSLAIPQPVSMELYNIIGQRIVTVINTTQQDAGVYTFSYDATQLDAGVYTIRVKMGEEVFAQKIVKTQ